MKTRLNYYLAILVGICQELQFRQVAVLSLQWLITGSLADCAGGLGKNCGSLPKVRDNPNVHEKITFYVSRRANFAESTYQNCRLSHHCTSKPLRGKL